MSCCVGVSASTRQPNPMTLAAIFSRISHDPDYQRLVALLTDPARRTAPASSAIKYLLSGLARCGVCTGRLRVLPVGKDGRKSDSYICSTATTYGGPGRAWTPS